MRPPNSAHLFSRIMAVLVDITIATSVVYIPAWINLTRMVGNPENSSAVFFIHFLLMTLALVLFLMRDSVRGISPGRYLFGIQATSLNNEPMTVGRSIKRNLPLMIWPVLLFTYKQETAKTWGDRIAATLVVKSATRFSLKRFLPLTPIL